MAINCQTNVSITDDYHRSVEFTVSFSEMKKLLDKRINEFRKQVSMKGFKPGQIPKQLFVSRFGDEVYRETVDRVVNKDLKEEFEKIIETWKADEKLEIVAPAEQGELIAEQGQDLVYKLSIALNKPLTVQGYKDLGISVPSVVVAEEEVNEAIQSLSKKFEPEQLAQNEAKLKLMITDDLLREKKEMARQSALKKAFDKLIEKNPFPVLEEQIKYTIERSFQRHGQQHDHEEEEIKISEEQLNEMRPDITRAIQEDRILRSIIEQESIKPTQGQVDARVQIMADSMRMDFATIKDAMRKNGEINKVREALKIELAQDLMIGETLPEKESV